MTTQRRGGGRPRKFTQSVKADIVKGMASGKTLLTMCDKHKVTREGVWRARIADTQFDADFEDAACEGIMAFLDDARKAMETAEGRDEILKHKELLRHAEWLAEKRLAIFQPASRAEVKIDGPMVVGWNVIDATANVFSDDQVNVRARTSIGSDRAALPAAE